MHVFPPRFIQAYLTRKAMKKVKELSSVEEVTTKEYKYDDATTPLDEVIALDSWNSRFIKLIATRGSDDKGGKDGGIERAPDLANAENSFVLRGQKNYYLTSEYLVGQVSVGVIFVENDGSTETKAEEWFDEDKADVMAQVWRGLNWWSEMGGYQASLTWVYDVHHATVPVEPIKHTKQESETWINAAIGQLGYKDGKDYTLNREYANDIRDKYKSDWAFAVYIVPSSNDESGYFGNDSTTIAWAYLGGPYMVISNKCAGWGYTNVWKVVAHETAHIFNALDEYKGSSDGNDYSGRLNVVNGNHEDGGIAQNPCLMKTEDMLLCQFTEGQVGWADKDGNGIFDSDYLKISERFHLDKAVSNKKRTDLSSAFSEKMSISFSTDEAVLMQDDFSVNNGWYSDSNCFIKSGRYHMFDRTTGVSSWLEQPFDDFAAQAETRWVKGNPTSGYGLMFRVFGPNDAYIFLINAKGQFCLGKYVLGNFLFIQNWTYTSSLKARDENILGLKCIGSSIELFINNNKVYKTTDTTFTKGSIGFVTLPNVHASFDNLVVQEPARK